MNTEDQQVLILLHECPTETSRHAKRGGGEALPSLSICVTLSAHMPDTDTFFPALMDLCASTQQSRVAKTKSAVILTSYLLRVE